ncbi:glutaredoxin domain-containing protein [Prauserella alba]|uniref:Mycoredoxin n=1 Tax=Prauserella alba TaxID=176898 RepID=A0ABN1VCE8_9PSEU|nr:glutaredoxin domain-containing protein [Prauserella alba]MCP2178919.1 Glutaredoxin [Prauserella alba]
MDEDGATAVEAVEVYWRPGCPFCMALRPRLRRSGLPIREVDIWADPAAAARVREAAGGNETVPTVFVGPTALVNPSVREVKAAVDRYAPALRAHTRSRRQWWRRRGTSGA